MAGRRSTVRRKRPFALALMAASGLHVLLGMGLLAGIKVMPPLVEQTLIVDLVDAAPPPAPRVEAPSAPAPAPSAPPAPRARAVVPPPPAAQVAAAPAPQAPAAPQAPRAAAAPPGFKSRGTPTPGGDDLRTAAREGGGCNHADLYRLTKAERAACDDKLGIKAKDAPMYAVIDQAKKDFFDGACKKDDEWCLYRTGQGPYPGLLALMKKKKDDW
ncbi:hypothetical protein C1707_08625 [Caulobacter flavus]|uniref:Uncharacterized protein n=3 Tax=Caulobacter flavus TaxID=1679497 RepID=A0ABM6ZWI9_9CAUL|nr:hypothetical protein [Caulobacter flavus]AYV46314.1 hypothetical protein C1707_08625 [Caulobacter flavus]